MTTYRAPDYDIQLNIAPKVFQNIAGVAYSVNIVFNGDQRDRAGLLIIPQMQDFPETSSVANAWLWLNDSLDVPEQIGLNITINKPCSPKHDPQINLRQFTTLAAYDGFSFKGVVIKNWNPKS